MEDFRDGVIPYITYLYTFQHFVLNVEIDVELKMYFEIFRN